MGADRGGLDCLLRVNRDGWTMYCSYVSFGSAQIWIDIPAVSNSSDISYQPRVSSRYAHFLGIVFHFQAHHPILGHLRPLSTSP